MTSAVLGLLLASQVAAPGPWRPQVGDLRRYATSDGGHAELRVIRVQHAGEQTHATLEQTWSYQGQSRRRRMTWLRSDEGLAIRLPGSDPEEFGPIVCHLEAARLQDSWTAQEGAFRDAAGQRVHYRLVARLEAIEAVTVAAGTFAGCHRVAYRLELPQEEPTPRTLLWVWIKPDLGIVRTRSERAGQVRETELVGYRERASGR